MKTRAEAADLGFFVRANLYLEGALGDVLAGVGDIDDVVAGYLWLIDDLACEIIDLPQGGWDLGSSGSDDVDL
jgi:hypothetical protein